MNLFFFVSLSMAELKVILDGYTVKRTEHDLGKFTITKSQENKKPFSSDITFYGQARQIILDKIINVNQSNLAIISCDIYWDDVLKLSGEVKGNSIEFQIGDCNEDSCGIECKIVERKDKLDYFRDHLVYQNIDPTGHPIIQMNKDVGELMEAVAKIVQIIWLTLSPITFTWALLLKTINLIIKVLKVLGFKHNPIEMAQDKSLFQLAFDIADDILLSIDRIYKYPSPLIRSYIQNALDETGTKTGAIYTFSSSLFNSPSSDLYNLAYFNAPITEGHINDQQGLIDDNHPVKTMDTFLEELGKVFNFEWHFVGDVFYLEHPDFFKNLGEQIDLDGQCGKFKIRSINYPARLKIGYIKDTLDLPERYHEVDLNSPENQVQKGLDKIDFQFGDSFVTTFTGLFGKKKADDNILAMKEVFASLPKLLLVDDSLKLLEDQTNIDPETIYNNYHTTNDPQNDAFYQYEIQVEVYLCDYTFDTFDTILYKDQEIKVQQIEYEYEPDRKITVSGLIKNVNIS